MATFSSVIAVFSGARGKGSKIKGGSGEGKQPSAKLRGEVFSTGSGRRFLKGMAIDAFGAIRISFWVFAA